MLTMSDFRQREGRLFTHRLKDSNWGEDRLFDEELRAVRAWIKKRGIAAGPLFIHSQQNRDRPAARLRDYEGGVRTYRHPG
jgi:hypothetical protein